MLALIVLLLEFYAGLCIERAFVLGHVVAIDGARHGERRKGIEAFGLFFVTRKANATYHRQLHLVAHLTVQAIDEGMIAGILSIGENELTIDDINTTQYVLLFGDELLPVVDSRLTDIGCHDASLRSSVVGIDVDLVAFIVDGTILVVHVVRHLDKL